MITEADLAALCHEFTNALTEVLAENTAGPTRFISIGYVQNWRRGCLSFQLSESRE